MKVKKWVKTLVTTLVIGWCIYLGIGAIFYLKVFFSGVSVGLAIVLGTILLSLFFMPVYAPYAILEHGREKAEEKLTTGKAIFTYIMWAIIGCAVGWCILFVLGLISTFLAA